MKDKFSGGGWNDNVFYLAAETKWRRVEGSCKRVEAWKFMLEKQKIINFEMGTGWCFELLYETFFKSENVEKNDVD